jgi:hypothetical protein
LSDGIPASFVLNAADFFSQLRKYIAEIDDQTVVRDLENWRSGATTLPV